MELSHDIDWNKLEYGLPHPTEPAHIGEGSPLQRRPWMMATANGWSHCFRKKSMTRYGRMPDDRPEPWAIRRMDLPISLRALACRTSGVASCSISRNGRTPPAECLRNQGVSNHIIRVPTEPPGL